ncbi:MAG: Uma2 family endonuclease [Bacteroidia bacterium]|nr:Uma2 family endonuclease [Bacteroidia bacterium]
MGEHKLDRFYSLQEYMLLEQADPDTRYEYIEGYIYAMAGGSIHNGLIISNITFRLQEKLRVGVSLCTTFGSDVKISVGSRNTYLYPDAFVVCGEIREDTQHEDAITNPHLIIEVLSKSTQNYDKTRKYRLYRTIPSLKEYVLIDQYQPVVETFFRKPDGDWEIHTYYHLDDEVYFQSLDISIPMNRIYERVSIL